ncbi:hypothetical protein N0V93_001631 [Gnomoniopsis smithogilvyi]|uniref:Zn(2)-C6 fungal-type domain-containing protein n=1 Tax=Gnomoniopsis smithogilvyi TaxID=1191159 RepID=A0A9W8Z2F0_9PEZI|nr:hypothetical protein N0V93_001631 [Gnomoniopsis smithogilvyi]
MSSQPRYRSACDRCHSQKLRCPKQTGSPICARCSKARAKCVYSPPGTALVGNNDNRLLVDVAPSDIVMENDGGLAAFANAEASDWPPTLPYDFDFTSYLPAQAEDPAHPSTGNAPVNIANVTAHPVTISQHSQFDKSSDARSACTKELTSLLLESDQIRAQMPLHAGLHISQSEASHAFLEALSAKMATRSVLESFFVLAQRLIDIYPTAIRSSLAPDQIKNSACDVSDCTHNIDLVNGLKEVEESIFEQGTLSGPDMALSNLLVACHARQLDILDCVLLLVTSCTRFTLASRKEPDFDVSETRVGSFVPQRTAAVLMQVALLKHLLATLTDRLASFGKAVLEWTQNTTNMGLESSILKLQHESLTKRQVTKATQVGLVEDFLMKFEFHRE